MRARIRCSLSPTKNHRIAKTTIYEDLGRLSIGHRAKKELRVSFARNFAASILFTSVDDPFEIIFIQDTSASGLHSPEPPTNQWMILIFQETRTHRESFDRLIPPSSTAVLHRANLIYEQNPPPNNWHEKGTPTNCSRDKSHSNFIFTFIAYSSKIVRVEGAAAAVRTNYEKMCELGARKFRQR